MGEGVEGNERERERARCILSSEDFVGVCGYPRFIAVCYQGNCSM